MTNRIGTILRSPLLHFLLIGAVIYTIDAASSDDASAGESSRTLRVTAGEVAWLENSWAKRWNRPATPEELQSLISSHVRETVLYREALAMGLDKDDVIIRRRLTQKLEFLFQDLTDEVQPTEKELRQYFLEHVKRYQDPELLTFTHLYFNPDSRGEKTLSDAKATRINLEAIDKVPADVASLGDSFMLQSYYPQRPESEVAKLFGREFARSVFALSTGEWHGPVLSGYGTHLVYVHERVILPAPSFEAVRKKIVEDWKSQKREEFNDAYYESLLKRYDVIIEKEPSSKKKP